MWNNSWIVYYSRITEKLRALSSREKRRKEKNWQLYINILVNASLASTTSCTNVFEEPSRFFDQVQKTLFLRNQALSTWVLLILVKIQIKICVMVNSENFLNDAIRHVFGVKLGYCNVVCNLKQNLFSRLIVTKYISSRNCEALYSFDRIQDFFQRLIFLINFQKVISMSKCEFFYYLGW